MHAFPQINTFLYVALSMPEYQENCQVQNREILHQPHSERLDEAFCRLTLLAPRIAAAARPGQFVMAACAPGRDPLLRRPFSIHRVLGQDSIQLLLRVVGQGTRWLADLSPGAQVDLVGPLGHGFQYGATNKPATSQSEARHGLFGTLFRGFQRKKEEEHPLGPVCLIGGGIGIAPLLFLADQLLPRLGEAEKKSCVVLLGGRTRGELDPLAKEFITLGCAVECATDDGALGFHGMVTALLPPHLPQVQKVCCCGPHAMMAAVAAQCREAKVACEASLEANMACGLGACLGCAVRDSAGGYLHVCRKGPVVAAGEVEWNL